MRKLSENAFKRLSTEKKLLEKQFLRINPTTRKRAKEIANAYGLKIGPLYGRLVEIGLEELEKMQ